MPHVTNPAHTQFNLWLTRQASEAINEAARQRGISRSEYIQNAIWDGLDEPEENRETLLPTPKATNLRYMWKENHAPGYKGRWAMWVRGRATIHRSLPLRLTKLAIEAGDGSASAYIRRHLVAAIERDLGRTVVMPNGRSSSDLFGGVIHEGI